MRVMTVAMTLVLFVGSQSVSAQDKTPQGQTPTPSVEGLHC